MREFKTFHFNKNWLQITVATPLFSLIILALIEKNYPDLVGLKNIRGAESFTDISSFLLVFISLLFCLLIYCVLRIFNYTLITYDGIENRMAFPRITLVNKSWKEIKHYVDVTEIFSGGGRDDIIKAIWFIDHDDKVCLRLTKWGSFNFKKLVEKIDRFEDKFEIELHYRNPFLTINGLKKVDYLKNQKIK
jgi:hypothetical protein